MNPDAVNPDAEKALLRRVSEYAARFLQTLDDRPVAPAVSVAALREALHGPLPEGPTDPAKVIERLIDAAEPGVVAIPSGRYFGFVIGGELPAALAADWLTALWDQNAGLYVAGPSAAVAEEVASRWLTQLLGLPDGVSSAFVTGAQMANVVGLAAARHHVLAQAGYDLVGDGLQGAPPVRVLVGQNRHVTIDRALRLLGIGRRQVVEVDTDEQGRIRRGALGAALAGGNGPTIICAQAGDVNTGAFDPFHDMADAAAEIGAWLHVDGAFGLWAAASPAHAHLVAGVERADSWATDGHKWLNVPYDSGLAFCAHADAHRAAMSAQAGYLPPSGPGGGRDAWDWTPEASRRARGFPIYAAIASLGRSGIAELVERCCAHARRFAQELGADPGTTVLNDVVLNQVLVRFGDDDEFARDVVRRVQQDGTCYLGATTWRGMAAMRISVSNWRTTTADVERAVAAIRQAAQAHVAGAQTPRR